MYWIGFCQSDDIITSLISEYVTEKVQNIQRQFSSHFLKETLLKRDDSADSELNWKVTFNKKNLNCPFLEDLAIHSFHKM